MHHVSVIVPVFEDSARLAGCLEALANQTYPKAHYEVIVVDNGSTDDVASLVRRYPQARVYHEPRPGSYAARNKGISHAKGEILAFTDADCVPSRNWMESGVSALLRTPACGLVGGKVDVFFQDPARPGAVELYDAACGYLQKKYVEVDRYGATANMFTFRKLFEQIGLFNGELKSYGDVEWGRRVASHGYALVYAEEAVVAHPARKTLAALRQRIVRVTGGLHDLEQRNLDCPQDRQGMIRIPRSLMNVWRNEKLATVSQKAQVLAVLGWVQWLKACERTRLRLGGTSRR